MGCQRGTDGVASWWKNIISLLAPCLSNGRRDGRYNHGIIKRPLYMQLGLACAYDCTVHCAPSTVHCAPCIVHRAPSAYDCHRKWDASSFQMQACISTSQWWNFDPRIGQRYYAISIFYTKSKNEIFWIGQRYYVICIFKPNQRRRFFKSLINFLFVSDDFSILVPQVFLVKTL